MNTLSLSVSNPSRSKGSSLRSSVKTALSRPCSRTSNGPHSVHPVAMSVNTSVCTKLPLAEGPLCATKSASTKPGGGSYGSQHAWLPQGPPLDLVVTLDDATSAIL